MLEVGIYKREGRTKYNNESISTKNIKKKKSKIKNDHKLSGFLKDHKLKVNIELTLFKRNKN